MYVNNMADSCRPVSRHGRYHTSSRAMSDVQYSDNLQTYSTPSYGDNDGLYRMTTSPVEDEPVERPMTSRGHRRLRPKSRGGRKTEQVLIDDELEEGSGRPGSRRGFTPETYERHDYDEFSHQGIDNERQITPEYTSSPHMAYSPEGHLSPYMAGKPPTGPGSKSPYRESPLYRRHHGDEGHTRLSQKAGHYERQSPYNQRMSPGYEHQRSPLAYENNQNRFNYDHGADVSQPSESADVLRVDEPWPPTPRDKPPTPRPKSSKKRLKSGRRRQSESQLSTYSQESAAIDTPILRPPSSLSKYRPLPAISGPQNTSPSSMATETPSNMRRKSSTASDASKDVTDLTSQAQMFSLGERTRTFYDIDLHKVNNTPGEGQSSRSSHGADRSVDSERVTPSVDNENRRNSKDSSVNDKFKFKPHTLPTEPSESESRVQLAIRLPDGRRHQHYFRVAEKLDLVLKFAENVSGMDLSDQRLVCSAPRAVFADLTQSIQEAGILDKTVLYLEENE